MAFIHFFIRLTYSVAVRYTFQMFSKMVFVHDFLGLRIAATSKSICGSTRGKNRFSAALAKRRSSLAATSGRTSPFIRGRSRSTASSAASLSVAKGICWNTAAAFIWTRNPSSVTAVVRLFDARKCCRSTSSLVGWTHSNNNNNNNNNRTLRKNNTNKT